MAHQITVALYVGPGKTIYNNTLMNVNRVNFLLDKKLLQVYQEGSTNVKEFDTIIMTAVAFTIMDGNYHIQVAQ